MSDVRSTFASNLRIARKRQGLSQVLLAQRTTLSQGYIADLENGTKFPSPETIDKLCESLEIHPYRLFLRENDTVINAQDPLVVENLDRIRAEIHTLVDSMLTETLEERILRHGED